MSEKTLSEILSRVDSTKIATQTGTQMHNRLMGIKIDGKSTTGDEELIQKISAVPGLSQYFGPLSRPEVPIAGFIGSVFVSRRIDRLYINDADKIIVVLDYKTDTDKTAFYSKYVAQLHEYITLLRQIYSDYDISARILWTHDWTLETV
ncbi:MAG: hypothetical protein J6S06_00595 [Alphaproteobacteria bacterium]|nr:hypothetical protein [Alphaproteobacteria bacterium]